MKINFKHIARTAAMLSLVALPMVACDEDSYEYESTGGSPSIRAIVAASNPDSLVTSAFTGTRLVVLGDNLRSINKIIFNDQQAVLNIALITDNALYVSVPRSLPVVPTDQIYFINCSGDTVPYPFTVDIAAPVLASMACEYVRPGEVATIKGDYFLTYDNDPLTVTMPDGTPVSEIVSVEQQTLKFRVPEGCTEPGAITVRTKYGSTKSSKFWFNDNRGIMTNFNGEGGASTEENSLGKIPQGWNIAATYSDENGIDGQYCILTSELTEEGAGWNEALKLPFWAGSWNGDVYGTTGAGAPFCNFIDFTDFNNMAVKFELCIPKTSPWTGGGMMLLFANAEDCANDSWQNNTYIHTEAKGGKGYGRYWWRPWQDGGSYETGDEWVTVTCPIADFKYDMDGATCTRPLKAPEDFASFILWINDGGVKGTFPCTPIFKIDNIRAVPYK